VFIFSDASEKAITAVSYLRLQDKDGIYSCGFLLGKAKLAPLKGHTIPRLELCAAVLAVELAEIISAQLNIPISSMIFYSDSKVVLGYLSNKTRRFFTYVSNRIERVLNVSSSEQWRYVPTEQNPADFATRYLPVCEEIENSVWIKGPDLLYDDTLDTQVTRPTSFELLKPEEDCEIRPEVHVKKTVEFCDITTKFEKFSTWTSLITAFTVLKKACMMYKSGKILTTNHVENREATQNFVINEVQKIAFDSEIQTLSKKQVLSAKSSIATLSPFLNQHGVLCVGGRIDKAPVEDVTKHPVIIQKKSHVALLLVRYFHEKSHHQGRFITEALLRNGGFWIIGAKRLISSTIHRCVICRRLRGRFSS
jgi:hypothetical protein